MELKYLKRLTIVYVALLIFSTIIIVFTDFKHMWILNLLVGFWTVEQTFSLNKEAGRPCTNWRDFRDIFREFSTKNDLQK